jgi:predicted Zn-dependent protease
MAQVIQVQPQQDRHSYFVRVTKLLEEGELDKAFEALDEVLMKDPNDAQAMVLASEVLKKAKKLPIAYSMAR